MRIVGRDAIVFEREKLGSAWKNTTDPLGRFFGAPPRALVDVATILDLGDGLTPGPPVARMPETKARGSVIGDLFNASGTSKEAGQALLDWKPPGWNETVLHYMLTTRVGAFNDTKDYQPVQIGLRAALAGEDPVSTRLTHEALLALKGQIAGCFGRGDDGKLTITDRPKLDQLGFLRYPIGSAMAANINNIFDIYDKRAPAFAGLTKTDLDHLLAFAGRDDQAFKELVRAQSERMRNIINAAYNDGSQKYILDQILPESRFLGHLLEARRLALMSESLDDKKTAADLRTNVASGLGLLISVPTRGAGAIPALAPLEGKIADAAYDNLAAVIANRLIQHRLSTGAAVETAQSDHEMVAGAMSDLIIASKIAHNDWSPQVLRSTRGQPFATGDEPPKIKPLDELSPDDFDRFVHWARRHSDVEDVRSRAVTEMSSGVFETHNGFGIDHY